MNIKPLEHLLALADTGSFSRAAEQCCLTQSALSRSIQNLEQELGGQLLDRIGKRNELTPLGREVVARARRIVLEASELRRSAERMQGGGGSIRVGLGSGPGGRARAVLGGDQSVVGSARGGHALAMADRCAKGRAADVTHSQQGNFIIEIDKSFDNYLFQITS